MTLDQFLKATEQKPAAFAAKIQVQPSTVTRWIKGERSPNVVMLSLIKRATDGAVTADDFVPKEASAA